MRALQVAVVLVLALMPAAPHPCAQGTSAVDQFRLEPLRRFEKTGGRLGFGAVSSRVVLKLAETESGRSEADRMGQKKGPASGLLADIAGRSDIAIERMFDVSGDDFRIEKRSLESQSGRELADLSLYFYVRAGDSLEAERIAATLEADPVVEFAYVEPLPLPPASPEVPAAKTSTAPAPDFTPIQYYLKKAPGGFGIDPARLREGGRGAGVRLIDIEYSWNLDHVDLPFATTHAPFLIDRGYDPYPEDQGNHGTAALGVLAGVDNGFGVTGMCPDADFGVLNPVVARNDYQLAQSIKRAADLLTHDGIRGDIIQVEQQSQGINNEIASLPPEFQPAVFDAIQYAVAKGVTVIEPAGNGGVRGTKAKGVSLDRQELGGRFDRKRFDSGAIIAGGGFPVDASRTPTSNYGSRVDVQGYGVYVVTLGYGDLYGAESAQTRFTSSFNGTSSATATVTGVAVLVQAALRANGVLALDPLLLRSVLVGTGTPDGSVRSQHVGPRPNADVAMRSVIDPAVPLITSIKYSERKQRLTVDGIYFRGPSAAQELRTVIYIGDQPLPTSFIDGYEGPYGTVTRVLSTGNIDQYLPVGDILFVAVGDASGPKSPRRVFIRK